LESFVDTHCHLNFNLFEADLSQVLERAWQAGIERILIPGIDLATSRQVVDLCERDPRLFAAVGVHPNDALSWDDQTLAELRRLAQHPRVLAMGEIGLDYYRDRAPRDVQQRILADQLELATDLAKPVLIHSRQSLEDLWPVLSSWQARLASQKHPMAARCGVLHSYDGDLTTALDALAHGFKIGISGPVTYRNAAAKQKVVASLPIEGLLLETDAPFLAPQPVRGQRNEPAYIPMIAEKIAALQAQSLESVAEITTRSADRLLGWRSDI
jgi:TatD DNase family protein